MYRGGLSLASHPLGHSPRDGLRHPLRVIRPRRVSFETHDFSGLDIPAASSLFRQADRIRRKPVRRKVDDFLDHIKARLAKYPELTAERLYREIVQLGYPGSRRTVRRYVAQIRPRQERVYKPVETLPGEQAQVDWGHEGTIEVNGQRLNLYSFHCVLSHSRVRYVEYTTSQDMATFLACHERAFRYVGGCPRKIVYDNTKTVVSERVGSVIRFHPDFLRFAAAYGFRPHACWLNDPESKGKVESSVGYVRRDFFYGTEFASCEDLNRQGRTWMDGVANARVCEATGRAPFVLLEEERPFLLPLPEKPVSAYAEAEVRVSKTCLIAWGGNQYSVPHQLARQKVKLHIYAERLEVLFAGAGGNSPPMPGQGPAHRAGGALRRASSRSQRQAHHLAAAL